MGVVMVLGVTNSRTIEADKARTNDDFYYAELHFRLQRENLKQS
jgi:hypothetical protein